jgi:hypothetical protein
MDKNDDSSRPVATAKEVLDFLVKKGIINYSSYDKVYFYWQNESTVYLDFKLE